MGKKNEMPDALKDQNPATAVAGSTAPEVNLGELTDDEHVDKAPGVTTVTETAEADAPKGDAAKNPPTSVGGSTQAPRLSVDGVNEVADLRLLREVDELSAAEIDAELKVIGDPHGVAVKYARESEALRRAESTRREEFDGSMSLRHMEQRRLDQKKSALEERARLLRIRRESLARAAKEAEAAKKAAAV